jgi:hypothetical protein
MQQPQPSILRASVPTSPLRGSRGGRRHSAASQNLFTCVHCIEILYFSELSSPLRCADMRSTERRASLRAVVPLRVRVWSHMVPFSSSEKICSTICLASHISFFGEHSGTYTRSGPEETAGRRPQHAGILRSSCVHGPARSTGRTLSLAVCGCRESTFCVSSHRSTKRHSENTHTEACVRVYLSARRTDSTQ